MKRVLIIDSCHKCPNRTGRICELNGNYLLSVPGFPSWCPLKTVESFYENLRKAEEDGN